MRHSIRFDVGPEDVTVTTSGTATLAGLDDVVNALLMDVRYLPGMKMLFDHRRLDLGALRGEDLVRRLHVSLKEADLLGPQLIAVVSSDPALTDASQVRENEPTWEAFETLDEARDWLNEIYVPA